MKNPDLLNAHYISEFWAQAKKIPSKICARKMQKKEPSTMLV